MNDMSKGRDGATAGSELATADIARVLKLLIWFP